MRKQIKPQNLFCLLLALSVILSCATTIFAAGSHAGNNPSTNLDLENAVIDEVCKRVVESYAEYI